MVPESGTGLTESLGCSKMTAHREVSRGGFSVIGILSDLVLFSCLAAFITGIVLAVANVLS
jgi:thiol:disulfide interchange protein